MDSPDGFCVSYFPHMLGKLLLFQPLFAAGRGIWLTVRSISFHNEMPESLITLTHVWHGCSACRDLALVECVCVEACVGYFRPKRKTMAHFDAGSCSANFQL